MPNLVVAGTAALDSVETPFGRVNEVLGGSTVYSSWAASFFTTVGIVAAVGKDFPAKYIDMLSERNICTKGLQVLDGRTFRWHGLYEYDMNFAHTLKTEMNVLGSFSPKLPEEYKKAQYLFLANIDPGLQMDILGQMNDLRLSVMDTMNFWISGKRDELMEVMKNVDIVLLNDAEARQLFSSTNLVSIGKKMLGLGLKAAVIKKGEHGVLLFTENGIFSVPGYPMENVRDPTGAGDSFAGAFVGYLAKEDASEENMKKAVVYGSAVASFNVEDFSLNKLISITNGDIERRYEEFKNIIKFWD